MQEETVCANASITLCGGNFCSHRTANYALTYWYSSYISLRALAHALLG